MSNLGKVGTVGRFKPLHNGGALMLETICNNSDSVIIGIGSSNKYNVRNPFTAIESKGMIDSFLSSRFDNYRVIFVPDFGHIKEYSDGKKWTEFVTENFGLLDNFITGNPYTKQLLEPYYKIIQPSDLIPKERWQNVKGTIVRRCIAQGLYKHLIPDEVCKYMDGENLISRFQQEFGIQTLAELKNLNECLHEKFEEERIHTYEK